MMPRLTLFTFVLLAALPFDELRADQIEHRGIKFWIYELDPTQVKLELHLSGKKGEPNTMTKVRDRIANKGRQLKFAMNSGIFEGNFLPTGLHIADGKTITKLNTETFVKQSEGQLTPNFFLKPNGVFYVTPDGTAAVRETSDYAKTNIKPRPYLATQSGPLLVQNRVIHPALNLESTSTRFRNGVGVTELGKVFFACSVLDREVGMSNLYTFAELFRDKLGCPNALYLDGDISYVYIHGETPPLEDTNWFAGILAITEPVPE